MATGHCLSEYRLDRYALGLEAPEQSEQSRQHIAHCERCQKDLQELQQLRAQASQVSIPSLPWWRELSLGWFGWEQSWPRVLAVAAMLVVLGASTYLLAPLWNKQPFGENWSARGNPVLMVALRRSGHVRHARSGETFFAGDQIRLIYRWAEPGYLFVVHRDRHHKLTPLYPQNPDQPSVATGRGGNQLLPGSLEVEGKADGAEEIWACFSQQPLRFHQVRQSIPSSVAPHLRWQPGPRRQCQHLIRFVMQRQ